jgi:hypothetical protein
MMARTLAAFVTAGLCVWFAPALGTFGVIGQVVLTIIGLSLLEHLLQRPAGEKERGNHDPG